MRPGGKDGQPPGLRHRGRPADEGLVAFYTRPLFPVRVLCAITARRLALVLASLTALAGMPLLSAAPAGAVVMTVGANEYGVQPQTSAASTPTKPLAYGGGPVVHSNETYAIYWDPNDAYAAWETEVSGFLQKVGKSSGSLSSVYAVTTQYREGSTGATSAYESSFHGAYTDTDSYPSTENCEETGEPCLTDAQIRTELTKYISANGLPTGLNSASHSTPIYFVFTPPNVTVCLDATTNDCSTEASGEPLCSYHSFMTLSEEKVLYGVVPWSPVSNCQDGSGSLVEPTKSLADVIVNEVADQQIAAVTDPLFTAWHDTTEETGDTYEAPDKCRNDFSPASSTSNQSIGGTAYYLNDEFNQAGLYESYPGEACLNQVTVEPKFTAPNPVNSSEPVTFNATASSVDLGVAKYDWTFGDGQTAEVNCEGRTPTFRHSPVECGTGSGVASPNPVASVVHEYAYGGTYDVRLTVTDDAGDTATSYASITVSGSPPPSPSTSSTSSSSSTTSTTTSTTSTAALVLPAPVAAQAVSSTVLGKVTRKGLPVRYSVNEQVTGTFEVLLAAKIAKRMHLHLLRAKGLAAGTPPQVVVGKAVLITTKGGRGSLKIHFGKKTGRRLRRRHKVQVLLWLHVRNASGATTAVLSKITLHR
jgi:PKD domain